MRLGSLGECQAHRPSGNRLHLRLEEQERRHDVRTRHVNYERDFALASIRHDFQEGEDRLPLTIAAMRKYFSVSSFALLFNSNLRRVAICVLMLGD